MEHLLKLVAHICGWGSLELFELHLERSHLKEGLLVYAGSVMLGLTSALLALTPLRPKLLRHSSLLPNNLARLPIFSPRLACRTHDDTLRISHLIRHFIIILAILQSLHS